MTGGDRGAGVTELIGRMLDDDLRSLQLNVEKHGVLLGRLGEREMRIDPEGKTVLLCGQSGGGKSTFVAGFIERLTARDYQVCIVDPEGDYENMGGFLTLGNEDHAPSLEEISQSLDNPRSNLVVNLVGVKMQDRPGVFDCVFAKLQEKRMREGRPHWVVVDETHHLLPSEWAPGSVEFGNQRSSLLLVTVHPAHVSPAALRLVNVFAVIGKEPLKAAEEFARVIDIPNPPITSSDLQPGELCVWFRETNEVVERLQSVPGKAERKRHRRKYAEGELEPERVFYFGGPEGKMNLRAPNLTLFIQMAAGIDDDTWMFHLRRGDYSRWLSEGVKDADLAREVKRVEGDESLSSEQSRHEITKAIEAKYTAPV